MLMTTMIFTFVLIAGNLLKEVLSLVVSGNVSIWIVFKSLFLLIPWVMAFALPISFLMSGLMVFGRFSADQEYTAARSAGINLISLAMPVILLSVAMSGLCAWFNLQISPSSRVAYKRIFEDQMKNLASFIPEGRYVDFGDQFVIYVSQVRGEDLSNIRLYQFEKGRKRLDAFAESGKLIHNPETDSIRLRLNNARVLTQIGETDVFFKENFGMGNSNEKESLDSVSAESSEPDERSVAADWLPLYLAEYETEDIPLNLARFHESVDISDMTLKQMIEGMRAAEAQGLDVRPYLKYIHHQTAFSFACISFILVAIPLGLKTQRRETNISLALALIVLLVYYAFFILGDALVENTNQELYPWILYWIPNLLFQGVGLYLLWRANRGIG